MKWSKKSLTDAEDDEEDAVDDQLPDGRAHEDLAIAAVLLHLARGPHATYARGEPPPAALGRLFFLLHQLLIVRVHARVLLGLGRRLRVPRGGADACGGRATARGRRGHPMRPGRGRAAGRGRRGRPLGAAGGRAAGFGLRGGHDGRRFFVVGHVGVGLGAERAGLSFLTH